jgi:nicotinate-nucleotide adenylyltransferase
VSVTFGVFGGSFDPPHVAHTLLAAYALSAYRLERVLVIPTYEHPFGKALSAFEDRIRMCEFAFAELPRVEVSSLERELSRPSLTVHTLEALKRLHPGVELRLLMGADLVAETHAWHDFPRVAALAAPLIIERQGYETHASGRPALPDVSSTEVRRRLRAGESTEGLLSPAVANYARQHGLYTLDPV